MVANARNTHSALSSGARGSRARYGAQADLLPFAISMASLMASRSLSQNPSALGKNGLNIAASGTVTMACAVHTANASMKPIGAQNFSKT